MPFAIFGTNYLLLFFINVAVLVVPAQDDDVAILKLAYCIKFSLAWLFFVTAVNLTDRLYVCM